MKKILILFLPLIIIAIFLNSHLGVASEKPGFQLQDSTGVFRSWIVGMKTNTGTVSNAYWTPDFNNITDNFTVMGDVGIGTTSPLNKVHIVLNDALNNSVVTMVRLDHMTSGTSALGIGTGITFLAERNDGTAGVIGRVRGVFTDVTTGYEDGDLYFDTSENSVVSEKMRITSTGNVGIGTTSPATSLHLAKNSTNTSTVQEMIRSEVTSTGTVAGGFGCSQDVYLEDASGNPAQQASLMKTIWAIPTHGSETSAIAFSGVTSGGTITEWVRLISGNVGIGTTSPTSKLDVLGDIKFGNSNGDGYGHLFLTQKVARALPTTLFAGADDDLGTNELNFGGGTTGGYIVKNIKFHTAADNVTSGSNARMTIDSAGLVTIARNLTVSGSGNTKIAGNVGMGTTSPATSLHLAKNSTNTSTVQEMIRSEVTSTGTVANGFGCSQDVHIEDASGNAAQQATSIGSIWTISTHGSESSAITFSGITSGGTITEWVRLISGNVGIGTTSPTSKLQVVGLCVYANNAAAIAGGLTAGAFYRTGGDPDLVCVVH